MQRRQVWTVLAAATAASVAMTTASVQCGEDGHCHVHMRRMTARKRRFVAPGAIWKLEIGIEVLWETFELWARIPVFYRLDDLFSGRSVFASAREIANLVSQELAKSSGPSLSTAALRQLAAASLKESSAQGSTLFFTGRAVAEDQYNIFRSLESAMQELGVDGKACLLRTICELQESPVAEWTFLGEMFTSFLTPKEGDFSFLEEYQQARQLGTQRGGRDRCRPAYPQCPLSVFNFVPDIFGEDFVLPLGNITGT